MTKMRVLYSFPVRLGKDAGIGMTAWYQVKTLLPHNINMKLYCGSLEKPLAGLDKLRQTFVPFGLRIPLRLLGNSAMSIHDKLVARVLAKNHKEIDVVHCWPSAALETLKIAKRFGVKSVLERPSSHTQFVFNAVTNECEMLGMEMDKAHYTAFDQQRLEREEQEFELADKLLCPSEWVVKTFLSQGTHESKIARHQYGYDPDNFRLPLPDIRNKDKCFKMIFVGRAEPRKGLHYALDAWLGSKASNNGIFYICGEYVPGYREVLSDKLAHPSIKELGFRSDVNSLLQECHALVLPSISEGSALVTYEARACGCVLLVSESSGAHCTHMYDALVHKVGDVPSLRGHIDSISENRTYFQEIRNKSIEGIGDLTWEKASNSLLLAYRECLKTN